MKKVLKVFLYCFIAFIGLMILAVASGDEVKTDAEPTKEAPKTKPVELVSVPDEKILDFEVVQKKEDWGGRKLSDVYATITEKPANKTEIDATVRRIAKNYLKESKHIPDHLTVWLYTSKVQAADQNLHSEFIAQYWKNFNSKDETVKINDQKLDMLLGKGERFAAFNKVKKALTDKGIDFCQLHVLHRNWMRWSDEKSKEKYEPGDDRRMDYMDELYDREVNEFRKKFKVSEELWNESMTYGDYACDNSPE